MIRYSAANLNLQKKEAAEQNDFGIKPQKQKHNNLEEELLNDYPGQHRKRIQ